MQSRFKTGIICWMLLALLTPTSLKAQQETPYGTSRQPATCPSRSEPRTGRISSAQAIKYAICEVEGDQVVPQPGIANFLKFIRLKDRSGAMNDLERAAKLYQQDGNTEGYQMVLKAIEESKKY